ncbi:MAG: hypothetical protein ACHP7N_02430 [Caulobacterales bacterium]
MNKFLAILAGASVLALSGEASAANTDQKQVPVTGNVASLCVLGAPNPSSVDLGQMAQTSGANTGKITTITTQNILLANSFCNYAGTQLTIQSTALVAADTSPVQPGFARSVNFTSTVTTWATTPPSVTTAAAADGSNPTASGSGGTLCSPKLTDLTLALSNFTAPSNNLMVAGGYSGVVTITLGPSAGGCGV